MKEINPVIYDIRNESMDDSYTNQNVRNSERSEQFLDNRSFGNEIISFDVEAPDKPYVEIDGDKAIYYTDEQSIGYGVPAKVIDMSRTKLSEIADYMFYNFDNLEEIILPETVTKIGDDAFEGCSSMKNFDFGKDIDEIGSYAFSWCGLTSIELPEKINVIKEGTFRGCESLESVIMGDSITEIEEEAFYECPELVSVTFGPGLEVIGENSFEDCTKLTNVEFPNNLVEIGECAFEGCSLLTISNFPESLEKIGYSAFYECPELDVDLIPSNVANIGGSSFRSCGIENIELGCGAIGYEAFKYCENLKKVWIRNTCITIEEDIFYGCPDNLEIYVEASSKPEGWDDSFNMTGSDGSVAVAVVYNQTTRPF